MEIYILVVLIDLISCIYAQFQSRQTLRSVFLKSSLLQPVAAAMPTAGSAHSSSFSMVLSHSLSKSFFMSSSFEAVRSSPMKEFQFMVRRILSEFAVVFILFNLCMYYNHSSV